MTPVHLIGYKFIDELTKWHAAPKPFQERSWEIKPWRTSSGALVIKVSLAWRHGQQIARIDKHARSAEEATHLALDEFAKWEKLPGAARSAPDQTLRSQIRDRERMD